MTREIKFRVWDKATNEMYYQDIGGDCLMQYTGLKDKNGKEIYEGDIIDLLHPCWSNIAEVKYFENEACFGIESLEKINKGSRKSFLHIFQEPYLKLEVLGNIYENKDLLKNT